MPELKVFAYSEELRKLFQRKSSGLSMTEDDIRRQSALAVTAEDVVQLDQGLNPDVLVCLYVSAEVTRTRIQADVMGRPLPTALESDMHTHLQPRLSLSTVS